MQYAEISPAQLGRKGIAGRRDRRFCQRSSFSRIAWMRFSNERSQAMNLIMLT